RRDATSRPGSRRRWRRASPRASPRRCPGTVPGDSRAPFSAYIPFRRVRSRRGIAMNVTSIRANLMKAPWVRLFWSEALCGQGQAVLVAAGVVAVVLLLDVVGPVGVEVAVGLDGA